MTDRRRFVIAVDGPAGSGKSSVSRSAAERLHFAYLDTGAAYRALTWKVLQDGVDLEDPESIVRTLPDFNFSIGTDPLNYFVRVGETDVTAAIREADVTAAVKFVSRVPEVRHFLTDLFRSLMATADRVGIVVEGRDITTNVAPDAPVRVLLTADEEVRMARRAAELGGAAAVAVAVAGTGTAVPGTSAPAGAETATSAPVPGTTAPTPTAGAVDDLRERDQADSLVSEFMTAADGVTTLDSTFLDFPSTVTALVALAVSAGAPAPAPDKQDASDEPPAAASGAHTDHSAPTSAHSEHTPTTGTTPPSGTSKAKSHG